MKRSTLIRIIALVVGIILIISSLFIIRSCSAPPEYSSIRTRLEQLVEASYEVNEIIWGKGLPTYERVSDPRSSLALYKTDKTYTSNDGKELPLNYHYYYPISSEYTVIAYRREKDYKADFRYALLTDKEYDATALALLFPATAQGTEESYYTELYADEKSGKRAYSIPFTEKEYDFYYTAADSEDYDYILADSPYASVDSIKAYIRTVYDEKYADSLDSVLFDGIAEGSLVMKARYSPYVNSRGVSMLASLNTYEPLFEEERVYRFETGKIVRNSSNDERVVIELESYLPSEPDKIEIVKLAMTLGKDGKWYLSSPSY